MRELSVAIFVLVGSLLAPTSSLAQPNLLANGTFDTDLDGWTLPVEPGTTVVWDAFGDPGGSLRVTVTEPNTSTGIYSACISGPVGRYTVRGSSYHPSGDPALMICHASIRGWTLPDCQGSMATILPPGPPALDEWVPWEYVQFIGEMSGVGIESIVVDLTVQRFGGAGETTCYFDNIELIGPVQSPLEIPTLDWIGAALLIGLLAAGAIVVLRR